MISAMQVLVSVYLIRQTNHNQAKKIGGPSHGIAGPGLDLGLPVFWHTSLHAHAILNADYMWLDISSQFSLTGSIAIRLRAYLFILLSQ